MKKHFRVIIVFFAVACHLLTCVVPSLAQENCTIKQPLNSMDEGKFLSLLDCDPNTLFAKNTLSENDKEIILHKLAHLSFYEEKGYIFSLMNISHKLFPKNTEILRKLTDNYFNRYLRYDEKNEIVDKLVQFVGRTKAKEITLDLLRSQKPSTVANIGEFILEDSWIHIKFFEEEKESALAKLKISARSGSEMALQALALSKKIENDDNKALAELTEIARTFDFEKLPTFIAGSLYSKFMNSNPGHLSKQEIRTLFKKDSFDNSGLILVTRLLLDMNVLSQEPDFLAIKEYANSSLQICLSNKRKAIFECISEQSIKEMMDDIAVLNLLDLGKILDAFEFYNSESVAQNLIEQIFSKPIELDYKNSIAKLILPNVLVEDEASLKVSKQAANLLFDLKDKISEYMWLNYAFELAKSRTDSHFDILTVRESRASANFDEFLESENFLVYNKRFQSAIKYINIAENERFFSSLNGALYFHYSSMAVTDLRKIVNQALARIQKRFGKSKEYFNFKYHEHLLDEYEQSTNLLANLYNTIDEIKSQKLNPKLFQKRLVQFLVEAGAFSQAVPVALEVYKYDSQRALDLPTGDVLEGFYYGEACSSSILLALLQEITNKSKKNLDNIFTFCFDNLNYPARAAQFSQYSALNSILSEILDWRRLDYFPATRPKLYAFVSDFLEQNNGLDVLLAPFALTKIILTDKENERIETRQRYIDPLKGLEYTSKILESEKPKVDWIISAAENITSGYNHLSFLKSTLKFVSTELKPSLSSSIVSDQSAKIKNVSIHLNWKTIDEKYRTPEVIKKLYLIQQFQKFGPGEQLLLRSMVLDEKTKKEFNSLLSKRDLLMEEILFSDSTNTKEQNISNLAELNNKLKTFRFPKPDWPSIFPTPDEITKLIKSSEQFLNFRVNAENNVIELFSFSSSGVEMFVIENANKVEKETYSLLNKISNLDVDYVLEARYLFKILLEPYLKASTKRILISADKFIYKIPFDALVIDEFELLKASNVDNKELKINTRGLSSPKIKDKESKPVLHVSEKYQLSLVTTLNNNMPSKKELRSYNFVGIGNPNISGSTKIKDKKFNEYQISLTSKKRSVSNLSPLPGTENELRSIAENKLFNKSKLYLKNDATEKNVLRSKELTEASVISFATHGLLGGQIDDYSEPGLVLTPVNETEKNNDGFLSMTEVLNLRLNSEIVILSACDTGGSRSSFSPPFSGLASAFLTAGSEKVIVSLWQVDDEATSILMKILIEERNNYKDWSRAKSASISRFLAEYPQYSHPYFWSPFTLFSSSL